MQLSLARSAAPCARSRAGAPSRAGRRVQVTVLSKLVLQPTGLSREVKRHPAARATRCSSLTSTAPTAPWSTATRSRPWTTWSSPSAARLCSATSSWPSSRCSGSPMTGPPSRVPCRSVPYGTLADGALVGTKGNPKPLLRRSCACSGMQAGGQR
ncbi:hypothetical protein TSOC_005232 [Tetrabaena socialis]|uniref:Uncharacterized protein n=1 Tax=Tetrabaena socialis TaxID=47790 RepID=A0A2J8A6V8_9CHLO|nr:hypothetical protein TSOC_005232 [Tetrabaena socialis]|eukprot:PNH08259.1 hypothetical protein TSOC_005232 [Tetrabaena socialis]